MKLSQTGFTRSANQSLHMIYYRTISGLGPEQNIIYFGNG